MIRYSIERVLPEESRNERLENLKQYFLHILAEDQQEGSEFDCNVLDAIDELQRKYPRELIVR